MIRRKPFSFKPQLKLLEFVLLFILTSAVLIPDISAAAVVFYDAVISRYLSADYHIIYTDRFHSRILKSRSVGYGVLVKDYYVGVLTLFYLAFLNQIYSVGRQYSHLFEGFHKSEKLLFLLHILL